MLLQTIALTIWSVVSMSIRDRIAKLIDVKSITTLELAAAFVWLSIAGEISSEQFLTIFTTVIAFYYGTQAGKQTKEG